MCKFTLGNGAVHDEVDYAKPDGTGGWRDFPFKKELVQIEICRRVIKPEYYPIPGVFRGFAIHWIGVSSPGSLNPYVAREVMIVLKNSKVMCFCLNLKNKRWHDYADDLKSPDRPHLINYDLSVHGM